MEKKFALSRRAVPRGISGYSDLDFAYHIGCYCGHVDYIKENKIGKMLSSVTQNVTRALFYKTKKRT